MTDEERVVEEVARAIQARLAYHRVVVRDSEASEAAAAAVAVIRAQDGGAEAAVASRAAEMTDGVLELPSVQKLLAEARKYRALREAVEGLAEGAASAADLPVLKGDRFDAGVAATYRSYADRLRDILAATDGTP